MKDEFRASRSRAMTEYNQQPENAAANAARLMDIRADPEWRASASRRMASLHRQPGFAKAHSERKSVAMKAKYSDPAFRKAVSDRMKTLNEDPAFRAAHVARLKARTGARLIGLSATEVDEYKVLRSKGRYTHDDALRALQRADLIKQKQATGKS